MNGADGWKPASPWGGEDPAQSSPTALTDIPTSGLRLSLLAPEHALASLPRRCESLGRLRFLLPLQPLIPGERFGDQT